MTCEVYKDKSASNGLRKNSMVIHPRAGWSFQKMNIALDNLTLNTI